MCSDALPAFANESPGVYLTLKFMLDQAALGKVCKAYELSRTVENWVEECSLRSAQANFNPKPARILHILVKTHCLLNSSDICSAIFANLEPNKLALIAEKDFQQELARARAISSFLLTTEMKALSKQDSQIALAILVDEVRHFHLLKAWPEFFETRMNAIRDKLLPLLNAPTEPQLNALLASALDKFTRISTQGTKCENF